ncbi:MAG: T9SS type A sorting domain-containing protein [Lewinellaceae bacterium]|nr:T9SS type A sorting domain-containing protein [Saprospiraceae bacterium]MCB9339738.1 T9SS type A sorting domain-containing protein [Lewinellaceae bacterium]
MNPFPHLSFFPKKAFNCLPIVLVFSTLFFGEIPQASAVTYTWIPSTGNWSDPANWNCGGCGNYPGQTGNTDDVVLPASSGTITLDVSVTINNFTMPHKTISGPDTLTVNGTMNWTRGVISITMSLGSSSTLNISGTLDKIVNGTLFLAGTTNHSEGKITTGTGATINNSGTYSMTGNTCQVELGNSSFFNNPGQMALSMDGTPFSGFSGTLDNDGTITRSGGTGTLTISPDFINDGTFNHNTGSELRLQGNPIEQNNILNLHGGELLRTGTITVNNPFTLAAGQTWRMTSTTTINLAFSTSGNILFAPSGSGNLNGTGSLLMSGNLTLQINSNTITLNIPVDVGGNCDMLGTGTKTVNNTLTLNGTTDYDDGNLRIENAGKINNMGTFNYNSTGTITFNASPISTVLIENTGTFNVGVNGSISNSGTFLNGNIFKRNGGTGTFTMSCTVTNNGIFEQSTTGTILCNSGSFTNNNTVQGIGTIDFPSSFSQNGTISPGLSPGLLTFDQFNSSGSLNIEIQDDGDGNPATTGSPGSDYDQLAVTGAATLGGTLNLDFLGGYEPTLGNQWTIMTCNPCSGSFATINHPFQNSNAFSVGIVGNDVILTMSQALPVELLDFHAFEKDGDVVLQWETASETNNRSFQIERSVDGKNWENIGFVLGHGTSTTSHEYRFLDEKPLPGTNYYRLRQIDFDGQYSFSKTIIVRVGDGVGIQFYPNPSSGFIFLKTPEDEDVAIEIWDANGRLFLSEINPNPLDVRHLPTGRYFLRIKENGIVEPFIITR